MLKAALGGLALVFHPGVAAKSQGLVLLGELNCTACHAATAHQAAWISPKVAPRLADLGDRASAEWLRRYLASPQETMPGTTMPDVVHSLPARERAEAVEALTHYLLSLSPPNFHRVLPDRAAVSRGEALYHRVGCVACHAPQNTNQAPASVPLLQMAEKWSFDGLRRFLRDPLASRPSGRMPAVPLTDGEVADLAHYLLRETKVAAPLEVTRFQGRLRELGDLDSAEAAGTGSATHFTLEPFARERGYAIRFTGWLEVKQPGPYNFYLTAAGASRLAVEGEWLIGEDSWEREQVAGRRTLKLEAGRHSITVDYVQRGSATPALSVEWDGPGFAREAIPAARLSSEREPMEEPVAFVVDAGKAAKGRALYAQLRCASCHEQKSLIPPPPALAALADAGGCLAQQPAPGVPDFHLTTPQRTELRDAINPLKRTDLVAPSARQRLAHTLASLRCDACHERDGAGGVKAGPDVYFTSNGDDLGDEGRLPPRLDGVGDRLRLPWIARVLTQGATVRPYLNTRMPQYGVSNVGHLPELFVQLDRHEQVLPTAPDAPDVQREAGRKLVGTDGLSCIACHRFNRQPALTLQVLDLVTAGERLNEDWFRRFLRDPNRYHPGTRMPAFWPDGRSQLPALLGGDTDRQHAALWTYLADGIRAKFPEGLSRQNVELVVGGEAVVYRGKLWEAGYRAVAVGYPGQLNAAFDAEEMRLALLWRGRFLNAGPHWGVQGMGEIHPLGTDVVVLTHGSPFAVLTETNAPWPTAPAKSLGMKFRGYQLDAQKRPTLLYSSRDLRVEDFLEPVGGSGAAGLRRTLKFVGPPPAGLYFRLAVGKLSPASNAAWHLDDLLTLRLRPEARPIVRGSGAKQELLAPITAGAGGSQLEIEYVW